VAFFCPVTVAPPSHFADTTLSLYVQQFVMIRFHGVEFTPRPPQPSSWPSTMLSRVPMRPSSDLRTPPKPYSALVAPHSEPPSTSRWSAVGTSNTVLTAASTHSTAPSITHNCMRRSRTPTTSSPSYSPVTQPSGLNLARQYPHPLSPTREVCTVGFSPLYL
jgi:hypothetical protein